MGKSNIQWCDYTFNPWIGCRKVAPECANCYAETLDRNRYSKTLDGGSKSHPVSHWGSGPRHRTSVANWKGPIAWNRNAAEYVGTCPKCGTVKEMTHPPAPRECPHRGCDGMVVQYRPRVFCASLGDWLDDENVPIEWFVDLLFLIYSTPHLDWLLLTKRPQNFDSRLSTITSGKVKDDAFFAWIFSWFLAMHPEYGAPDHLAGPPENVWIGVSAGADQEAALAIPARVHFLSCEPMLRPMDTTHAGRFDWIIFGGESGSKARRMELKWIYEGLYFCRNHRVAPFVKQLGGNLGDDDLDNCARDSGRSMHDSHGGDMKEWPEYLRVREFPDFKTQRRGDAEVAEV